MNKNFYKYFLTIFCVFVLFLSLVNVYGDEQKKSNEVSKQPAHVEPVEKEKPTDTNNTVREEQKNKKRESAKKKVPAFWFLLPEK